MGNLSDSPTELEGKNATEDIGWQAKVYAPGCACRAPSIKRRLDAIREIAANLIGTEEVCRLQSGQEAIGTLALLVVRHRSEQALGS